MHRNYLLFSLLAGVSCQAEQLASAWVDRPPAIDGVAQAAEWDFRGSNTIVFPQGTLLVQNDARHLYLILEVTADIADDPPLTSAPWGDFVALTFDVDRNFRITPNVDISYGLQPGTHQPGLQRYLGPCSFTPLGPTAAKLATSFRRNGMVPKHRLWEIAIPLSEIRGEPGADVNFGFQVFSVNPSFNSFYPSKHDRDFSALWQIHLAEGLAGSLERKPTSQRAQTPYSNKRR